MPRRTFIIAYNAADSIDAVVAAVLTGGTNVIYGGNATTTNTIDSADTISVADIRNAVTELRTNKALPRLGELYAAYLHPRQAADLRAESGTGGFQDIVNKSKDEDTDVFNGNDNEVYVLNTMLSVLNRLYEEIRRGDLFTDSFQVDGNPTLEAFAERFENLEWKNTLNELNTAIASTRPTPHSPLSVCQNSVFMFIQDRGFSQ